MVSDPGELGSLCGVHGAPHCISTVAIPPLFPPTVSAGASPASPTGHASQPTYASQEGASREGACACCAALRDIHRGQPRARHSAPPHDSPHFSRRVPPLAPHRQRDPQRHNRGAAEAQQSTRGPPERRSHGRQQESRHGAGDPRATRIRGLRPCQLRHHAGAGGRVRVLPATKPYAQREAALGFREAGGRQACVCTGTLSRVSSLPAGAHHAKRERCWPRLGRAARGSTLHGRCVRMTSGVRTFKGVSHGMRWRTVPLVPQPRCRPVPHASICAPG